MDPKENERTWQELRAIRQRLHKLANSVAAALLLARANRRRLDTLEPKVEEMATADAIAEGVAEKLAERDVANESRLRQWSVRVGIAGAVIAGLVGLYDLAARLLH